MSSTSELVFIDTWLILSNTLISNIGGGVRPVVSIYERIYKIIVYSFTMHTRGKSRISSGSNVPYKSSCLNSSFLTLGSSVDGCISNSFSENLL